ncbi:MAG: sugar transferase [Syntrophus sp. (in: bacteria)]|nr:sugar transferase [Syntrophus sp. (in: bacteria)]
MKRFFDLCFSIVLITVILPFILFISGLIIISIGLPVVFIQTRPGLHGKPFRIYKFRTMKDVRDSMGMLLPDKIRLTALGKFLRKYSLDELPQLINVLCGNLSFIGPRPLLMEYLPRYTPEQARRHEVKPGITGWAQVNGRNAISWEEKFILDVWYVDHQSFLLDIKILLMTFIKVLKREGISADGHTTMPEFTGSCRNGE